MAQKSKPRTPRKSSYRGFEGVDLKKTHSGDESIALIENFRISDDGSLEKRCGYKAVYEADTSLWVTASYSTVENNKEVCYFTYENFVKKYSSATQTVTDIGEISTNYSNVFFFEYLDSLYISDGTNIFTVLSDSLSKSKFYIPLYGKDWDAFEGEHIEMPSLLWNKVAISYKLSTSPKSYLSLGHLNVESIDALYRNGNLLNEDQYSIHQGYNSIAVPEFAEGDEFLAIVTFIPDEQYENQRNELFSSNHTSLFHELNKNNLFFWGSENHNKVFYSTYADQDAAKITYLHPENSTFYVPMGSFFSVASQKDRVNAFIRHYDRVLIMTDSSTWITNLQDLESNNLKLKNINSSIGCNLRNGCVRIENTLFSVGKDAIYAWSADTDELNECNAYSISEPIKHLLNKNFFRNCLVHLNYTDREIWFFNFEQNCTWIYNYTRKLWYSFSGFSPSTFLDGGDQVRFVEDSYVYVFDKSLFYDKKSINNNRAIVATLKSGELEFNSNHKKKLSSTTVKGECNSGNITLRITLDSKKTLMYDITPKNTHSVNIFRTKTGSFKTLYFTLIASGAGMQTIHGIELDAN